VVKAILTIRDDPPEGLQRTPGPVAIKYYLPRCQELRGQNYHLPTSNRLAQSRFSAELGQSHTQQIEVKLSSQP
jgi:hypothetical protein